jgi:Caspase domain
MNIFSRRFKLSLLGMLTALLLIHQVDGPVFAQYSTQVHESRVTAISAQTAEASRVHVALLVYGPNNHFGNACRNDVCAFRVMLEQGFGVKKDRLVFHDFTGLNPQTGLDWTSEQIMAYLADLRLGANESIVVFHSGHGAIADPSRPEETQFLSLNHGNMNRGNLIATLRAKQPRALILLTDCCSSIVPGVGAGRGLAASTKEANVNAQTVQALFLQVKGVVSVTAADVGDSALAGFQGANPAGAGSAFTVAMLRLLCDQTKAFRTWKDFFPVLRDETFQASQVPDCLPHRAHAFVIEEVAVNPTGK